MMMKKEKNNSVYEFHNFDLILDYNRKDGFLIVKCKEYNKDIYKVAEFLKNMIDNKKKKTTMIIMDEEATIYCRYKIANSKNKWNNNESR